MDLKDIVKGGDGEYLKATEIAGKQVRVKISKLEVRELKSLDDPDRLEKKGILHFEGKKKQLVLNKTNSKTLAKLFGDKDLEKAWVGKEIVMFTVETQNPAGETVQGIRLRSAEEGEVEVPF